MSGSTHRTGLRVAFLVESSSAGVGRHVVDLSEALAETGHDIHLLYSGRRMDSRFVSGVERLERLGIKCVRLDMAHGPHPADIRVIGLVRKYLLESGPFDLLHCHSTKAGLVGRIAAVGLPCRTAYTPHAFLTMSPVAGQVARRGARLVEWSLARIGDKVICVSDEELNHAVQIGLPRQKLSVVPNGINIARARQLRAERASMRHRFGLRDDQVCTGFVGRLFPQKEPQTLLDAFARATQMIGLSEHLVLVGDGPLLPALKEQVRRLNLGNRVTFAGEVDGQLAMAAFDVFALPSRYEGFPYVLVEALAMGLPIVSTDVGGASALVRSGENGFVVPVGRVEDMAQALRKVLADDGLRKSMAANSLWRSARFSLDRMLNETLAVYKHGTGLEWAPALAEAGSDPATVGLAELGIALTEAQPSTQQAVANAAVETVSTHK